MAKRLLLVAIMVAALLVLAAPALAFDGYRDTYVNAPTCAGCHDTGGMAQPVSPDWALTAHAMVGVVALDPTTGGVIGGTANAEPIAFGPRCAGCHSSNYSPAKHVPNAAGVYPWENTAGDDAFSEPFVGCSSCHWGKNEAADTSPTAAHQAPAGNMANADICGQCHSRYSASVVKYPNYDGSTATREYTLGNFNPLGSPTTDPAWTPDPITDYLNIANKDAPQSMIYYTFEGVNQPWNARGHEEGAMQYNEWANEGHANALNGLTSKVFWPFLPEAAKQGCLECHSTDYKLMEEKGEAPASTDAKYGVTCVGCHKPHTQSAQTSFWNEERNPQLTATRQTLCVQCHNAELEPQTDGQPGVATAGSTVHHPMKEMMNGTGAIDVPQGSPSVHKGRCVQCHMVPTSYDRFGVPMTGANHDFGIVEPEVAAEAVTTKAIGGEIRHMPASSCSSCHKQDGTQYALYLQETLDDRQEAMANWDAQVTTALAAAAVKLGFTGATDAAKIKNANDTLNAKGAATWNASQLAFQKAFTNRSYVESEGSWGIHNWEYARTVILKARDQAQSVNNVTIVTIRADRTSVRVNGRVKLSGSVATASTGTVTIQRKKGSGSWSNWKTDTLDTAGKYSGSYKMTARGTFYFRAKFAASDTQIGGTSSKVRVRVR